MRQGDTRLVITSHGRLAFVKSKQGERRHVIQSNMRTRQRRGQSRSHTDANSGDSDSDWHDANPRPLKRKKQVTDTVISPHRQHRQLVSHRRSLHVLEKPAEIRAALLQWYSGVHAVRGMPWRKPYDQTLSPDARSQRAYEV